MQDPFDLKSAPILSFLKNRARKNAEAREVEVQQPPPPEAAVPPALAPKTEGLDPPHSPEPAPPPEPVRAEPPPPPARYAIREGDDGWSVVDKQTNATAETYGYRLTGMSRSRAESLVEVLNRGEARKRGRNG